MEVVIVQNKPSYKDPKLSMEVIADKLNEQIGESKVDLIIMAEMALIGYKFTSREDILPFCESVTTNYDAVTPDMQTLNFCLELSHKHDCWVVCGFAENDSEKLYNS